ncbi:MAG: PEP/pyruvate-binding domain-containing protein, partial [Candidatus Edwardsbacteria bacterium]|nr:PEP/pyruvate-binding domain-containing protein [Candidatus Edwardsbacteria bacterium]
MYIKKLADIKPDELALAGGKALNLARMADKRFAVPNGFCVTTDAYREYASLCGVEAAAMAPEEIRRRIIDGEISTGMQDEVIAAYWGLVGSYGGKIGVAVRSSAVSEDQAGASFAGQHDTILNVRAADALLAALKQRWAGLWSDRAAAYRRKNSIDPAAAAMAVVVQAMIEPESSGVIFTVNPVNGSRDELLVNAVWGLGEGLVSGRISPDEFVVSRKTLAVKKARIANKKTMVVPDETGGREALVPPARIKRPVLSDEQLKKLARISLTIETLFGAAQDIEWAYRAGMFHILQARPVTAVRKQALPGTVIWGHPANRELADDGVIFWSNWNTRENMPYPLKPMAWSFLNDILFPAIFRVLFG